LAKKKLPWQNRSPPSGWSPVKSEPGFFENIVDQVGNLITPPKQQKNPKGVPRRTKAPKKKSRSFHSSSSKYYKKSYKNLIRLTKPQLIRMANKKGLNTSGQKADLAKRIVNEKNTSSSYGLQQTFHESQKGYKKQKVNRKKEYHSSSELKKTKKQLLRLSKKQLQRLAEKKGVNHEGKKNDIINRIKSQESSS